jgi:hypothetical protein
MNTKTLSYQNTPTTKPQLFLGIAKALSNLEEVIQRFKIKMAQANYHSKMKHRAQAEIQHDALRDLPLEKKLQLGCYHLMD